MSFVICQFSVSIPLLFSTYSSASSHALSYAFVTSMYTIYRGFFLFFCVAMLSFSIVRWSVVDLSSLPPACASDIFYLWSSAVVYYSFIDFFPVLLDTVMPLSYRTRAHTSKVKTIISLANPFTVRIRPQRDIRWSRSSVVHFYRIYDPDFLDVFCYVVFIDGSSSHGHSVVNILITKTLNNLIICQTRQHIVS